VNTESKVWELAEGIRAERIQIAKQVVLELKHSVMRRWIRGDGDAKAGRPIYSNVYTQMILKFYESIRSLQAYIATALMVARRFVVLEPTVSSLSIVNRLYRWFPLNRGGYSSIIVIMKPIG